MPPPPSVVDTISTEFDPALCLLGVTWLQVPTDGDEFHLSGGPLDLSVEAKVPDGTEFIHVSLLSSQAAFGTLGASTPRKVGAVRYHIRIKYRGDGKPDTSGGYCKFTFQAVLQDSDAMATTGPWSCFFILEIMFFGKRA